MKSNLDRYQWEKGNVKTIDPKKVKTFNGVGYNPYRDNKGRFASGPGSQLMGELGLPLSEADLVYMGSPDIFNSTLPVKGVASTAHVFDKMGYNRKPRVVKKGKFSPGATEAYRGIMEREPVVVDGKSLSYKEVFTDTDINYAGAGIYGNGAYAADDVVAASSYSDKEFKLLHIGIPKTAKGVSYEEITEKTSDVVRKLMTRNQERMMLAHRDGESLETLERLNQIRRGIASLYDEGIMASLLGYDYIYKKFHGDRTTYVILNKGAIEVSDEYYPGRYLV